jgi:hypothetical protein
MPPARSVVDRKIFIPERTGRALAKLGAAAPIRPAAAAAFHYEIVRTTEVDPYDRRIPRSAVPQIGAAVAPPSDDFAGTARKAAKLSIVDAKVEVFSDVGDLIATLPSKTAMKKHKPKITTGPDSGRVSEENRKVRVRGFLYAASREGDNDYHLMVGRDPARTPRMYMTMEVSGLPPKGSKSLARLRNARNAYKTFFKQTHLPGLTYDFYPKPIPVQVEGSLFFDMSHANGQEPGPPSLHKDIPTIWEVHPITKITFEP